MFNCACPYTCCAIIGIIFVVAIILIKMWYMGTCKRLKSKEAEILESIVYFLDFRGHFKTIGNNGNIFSKKIGKLGKKELREGRCRFGCFYFDDPYAIEDLNQLRYSIGLVFDKRIVSQELDNELIQIGLHKAELPKSKAIRTSFPYKNDCSYKIGGSKAWNMLFHKAEEMKYKDVMNAKSLGCFEIGSYDKIQYYLPIENCEKFCFTKLPPPKQKKGVLSNQKKND